MLTSQNESMYWIVYRKYLFVPVLRRGECLLNVLEFSEHIDISLNVSNLFFVDYWPSGLERYRVVRSGSMAEWFGASFLRRP